jgi:hypothetical protein
VGPRRRRTDFRLTTERKTLLKHLVRYRYLRTSHLYTLLGVGTKCTDRAVRRLLHDFWAHGFVGRRIVVAEPGLELTPRYEQVYWLAPSGVALARACGFCDDDFPAIRVRTTRTLAHDAAITDVHLAVERGCREHHGDLFWLQHRLKRGVNPDALFAITDNRLANDENTAYYFLEIERWREAGHQQGRSALLRRLHRYASYHGSDECQADWNWFDEFRVILLVPTERRRDNLVEKLSGDLALPIFWLGVEGSDITKHVFRSPADSVDRRYSLFD